MIVFLSVAGAMMLLPAKVTVAFAFLPLARLGMFTISCEVQPFMDHEILPLLTIAFLSFGTFREILTAPAQDVTEGAPTGCG